MRFAAIVERRLNHWQLYIPSLGTGGSVPETNDVQASAISLAAAATGLPAADLQVQLHVARQGETVVSTSPTTVEARHTDGRWRTAELTGWLRQWNGAWWPLVSYAADGATWTRAVRASRVRQLDLELSAVPAPRINIDPVSVVR